MITLNRLISFIAYICLAGLPYNIHAEDDQLETRAYDITNLVRFGNTYGYPENWLSNALRKVTFPDSWEEVGGPGVVRQYHNKLVVTQTKDIHKEVQSALEKILYTVQNETSSIDQPTSDNYYLNVYWLQDLQPYIVNTDHFVKDLKDVTHGYGPWPPFSGSGILGLKNLLLVSHDKNMQGHIQWLLPKLQNAASATLGNDVVYEEGNPAEDQYYLGVYDLDDLVASDDDIKNLIEIITSSIDPSAWSDWGGAGVITERLAREVFCIYQDKDTHAKVNNFLKDLRQQKESSTVSATK